MSVWISGAHGMLGHSFFRFFHEMDIPVKATDRADVDITDLEQILALTREHRFKYWINCSAYTHVDRAETEQEQAERINVQGVSNLIEAANIMTQEGAAPKIFHFSTDYVFDGFNATPYTEEERPHPLSHYGKTKLASEKLLLESPCKALVCRLSWLYGTHGRNFFKTILEKMRTQEAIYVVDDQTGSPTYVDDVPRWVWHLRDLSGLFHLCHEESTTWHGFAQEIALLARGMDFDLQVQLIEAVDSSQYPTAASRPSYSVLDTTKAKQCGVKLRPWQEALHDCLALLKRGEQ